MQNLPAKVLIWAVTLLAACVGHASDIQAAPADVEFFSAIGNALELQSRGALGTDHRLVNAKALLQIALKSGQNTSVPVSIPLTLHALACSSYGNYIGSVTPDRLSEFLASSNLLSHGILLLECSAAQFARTTNVTERAPRLSDFESLDIRDPAARERVDKRNRETAENNDAILARMRLKHGIRSLQFTLANLHHNAILSRNTQAVKIITQAFTESRLDEAAKAELLSKPAGYE